MRAKNGRFQKGHPSWIKGKHHSQEANERNSLAHRGNKNPNWKGGKRIDKNGAILIHVPTHPNASVEGCVFEHRLIAEKALGRKLRQKEVVHHIDKNTGNNSKNNLLICTNSYHSWLHHRMRRIEKSKGVQVKEQCLESD